MQNHFRCRNNHEFISPLPSPRCPVCGDPHVIPVPFNPPANKRSLSWLIYSSIILSSILFTGVLFLILKSEHADGNPTTKTNKLQNALPSATNDLEKTRNELTRLKDDNAKSEAKVTELTKSNNYLTQKINELQNALASTSDELNKTKQELKAKPQSELLEKNDVLTAKSNELQNALASATNDLEKTRKELNKLKDDNAKSEAKVTELTKSNNYLTQKINELQNALASTSDELNKTKQELKAKPQSELVEINRVLTAKSNELHNALASATNTISQINKIVFVSNNTIDLWFSHDYTNYVNSFIDFDELHIFFSEPIGKHLIISNKAIAKPRIEESRVRISFVWPDNKIPECVKNIPKQNQFIAGCKATLVLFMQNKKDPKVFCSNNIQKGGE